MCAIATIAILQLHGSLSYAQSGNGLLGEYRSGKISTTRTDSVVSFDWGTGSPSPTIPKDNFTATWTGQVEAPASGWFTFNIQADDGLKLWVDGKVVIDATRGYYPAWNISNYISLVKGKKYDIRLEYTETTGNALVQLCWTYPGQLRQVIPKDRLFSQPIVPDKHLVPSAPINLTAVGRWRNSCCDGKSMAHIELAWSLPETSPVAISTFSIYRDGILVKSGITDPYWEDMSVSSGQTYSYTVSGVSADGREGARSAAATATAPFPPDAWAAPTNLRVQGIWDTARNRPTDVLTWDQTPGAVRYNIYQYDKLIGSTTSSTSFTLPVDAFYRSITCAVTAVNSVGEETIPSNIISGQGGNDPRFRPSWTPDLPQLPTSLQGKAEWNAGNPRVCLTWSGSGNGYTFDIYRDGVKVARGLWGHTWYDNAVVVGKQYAYTVSGVNEPWTNFVEGPKAIPTLVTVTTSPAVVPGSRVNVTRTVSNDDSVKVYFDPIAGAVDYRAYNTASPGSYKYSGGGLNIEMNGLTPGTPATIVVEAVDKFGPFQKMDGMMGPGAMNHEGHSNMATNGIGDPSNIPLVIAASTPIQVSCTPRQLTGAQTFFDTFRNSQPLQPASVPAALLAANSNEVNAVENDRWIVYNVKGDLQASRSFIMGNHFMDTMYDGGTPSLGGILHIANASLVMQPKAFPDISGDKVLHVTFEVDAHFSGRRWCDVIIADANDPLMNPGKFWETNLMPTASGKVFRWQITHQIHTAELFDGKDGSGNLIATNLLDQGNGVGPDSFGPPNRQTVNWSDLPPFNGTIKDLDNRHRFDLYISKNRFRIMEEGKIVKDKVFPGNYTLPFNRLAVYFVHQVYHTDLERTETIMDRSSETYWINHRPYADERHWDNMGFEVLDAFPKGDNKGIVNIGIGTN